MIQTPINYKRYYDIDWIRVLIILDLFPFHTACLVIRWGQISFASNLPLDTSILWVYVTFVDKWHMCLLFLVAGISAFFSLERRPAKEYVKERIRRLLVPLIFGVIFIIPITSYYWQHAFKSSAVGFHNDFVVFLANYPRVFIHNGTHRWTHLWFIAYLFTYSVISLPLFIYIRKHDRGSLITRVATLCEKKGVILLFSIPLFFIQSVIHIKQLAWISFAFYRLILFIYGYIFCSDKRFLRAIEKNIAISLLLGFILTLYMFILLRYGEIPLPYYKFKYLTYEFLSDLNIWCWILVIMGLGARFLNFKNRALEYLNRASYPLYLLHFTVISIAGYYLTDSYPNLRYAPKAIEFFILSIMSFILSIAIYDLFIKRTKVGRFIFGMK